MKKIILVLSALVLSAGIMSAQDMAQATETYNAGAEALQIGNNESAIKKFEEAIALAEACGAEGADIIANCKEYIPQIQLSIAKEFYNTKQFEAALQQLEVVLASAKKYASETVAEEANSLKPLIFMQEGNKALMTKQFAEAVAKYQKVTDLDATNGMAFLRLGQALGSLGKTEDAENAFLQAIQNGKEKDAKKQLSNMFVKEAAKLLKNKDYKGAVASADKANSFLESATAMKIAGTAYSQLKDSKNAIDYLKKYVEISPKAKDANKIYYTIGALAQTAGDKATAIEFYKKILSDPKFGPAVQPLLDALQN